MHLKFDSLVTFLRLSEYYNVRTLYNHENLVEIRVFYVKIFFVRVDKSHAQCTCDHFTDIQIKFQAVVQQADVDGWYVPEDLIANVIKLGGSCGQTSSFLDGLINTSSPAFKTKSLEQSQIKNILASMIREVDESKRCELIYDKDSVQIGKMCPTLVFKGLLDELAWIVSNCYTSEIEEDDLVSVSF